LGATCWTQRGHRHASELVRSDVQHGLVTRATILEKARQPVHRSRHQPIAFFENRSNRSSRHKSKKNPAATECNQAVYALTGETPMMTTTQLGLERSLS